NGLVRQLAVALPELGGTRDEVDALLARGLVARDRRRDARQLLLDALLSAGVAGDPRVDCAHAGFEVIETTAGLIGGKEVGFEPGRANALIRAASAADVEPAARPTIALEPGIVTGAIQLEVRREAVLHALLTVRADRRHRPAGGAVLEPDSSPIRRETGLLAHSG